MWETYPITARSLRHEPGEQKECMAMNAATIREAEPPNALQLFHVNFNCSNLDRSRAFYESIGFKVVNDFSQGEPQTFAEIGLAPMLRLPADCRAKALLLSVSDQARTTRIDLIEWISPASEAPARGNLARIGFGRLCLKVKDCAALHARLVRDERVVYSEPLLIEMGGTRQLCFCCEDPDGIVIEFMQFLK